jgi:hypothetical protein
MEVFDKSTTQKFGFIELMSEHVSSLYLNYVAKSHFGSIVKLPYHNAS